jgi:hypothetical protein
MTRFPAVVRTQRRLISLRAVVQEAVALAEQAQVALEFGDIDESERLMAQALQMAPENTEVLDYMKATHECHYTV